MKQICCVPCNSFSKTQVFNTVSKIYIIHIFILKIPEGCPFFPLSYFSETLTTTTYHSTPVHCFSLDTNKHHMSFFPTSPFYWSYSPLPLGFVGGPPWLRYPVPFEGRMWTEEWIGTWLEKAMKNGKVQREKCLDDVGFVGRYPW